VDATCAGTASAATIRVRAISNRQEPTVTTDTDRTDPPERVAAWVRAAESVVALTGAGVSTASGIPDFRGPQGLWTRDPTAERMASIEHWVADPDVRRAGWRWRIDTDASRFSPNAAHRALAELESLGHLRLLITQNVDGLHLDAGTSPERLIEIHGTAREYSCLSCGGRGPIGAVFARVEDGEDDPHCLDCGGILKAATVSFGQQLDPTSVSRAHRETAGCDVFLAVGTSLTVYPVAALPEVALGAGARLVIVNHEPTPLDERAHVVVHDEVGEVLGELVARTRR
jgi:NAD-dependent deacetylase